MGKPRLYIMATKKLSGIYTITNKVTGKLYIGESLDIYRRWYKEHIPELRKNQHYNKGLQKDFNEYGEENFIFEILERYSEDNPIITKARILILESYYITQFEKSGIALYNSENSLAEILSGNKIPEAGNTVLDVIISTLKNYCIKNCEGFLYFDKRKTLDYLLFKYIVPKKGETKFLVLKEFETYLKENGKYKRFYVLTHFLNYIRDGEKKKIEIEEIREDKEKEIEKMIILFSEYREKKILKCTKPDVKNNKLNEVYDPIGNGEVRFSNLFKIFAKDGTLPENYSYYKIRDYLVELNVIEIKELESNGAITRITFATDYALDKKILRVVGRKKHGNSYIYNYVFTLNGITYMRNVFSNLSESKKIELFVRKEVA